MSKATAQEELKAKLESYHDILTDMVRISASSQWVEANYHDFEAIPFPQVGDEIIDLRLMYFDSMLMLYRRCFSSGHRVSLRRDQVEALLPDLIALHRRMLERADQVVAHAIDACSSSTLYAGNGEVVFSSVRPTASIYDFGILLNLSTRWIHFLREEMEILKKQYLTVSDGSEGDGSQVFFAPFGSGVNLQALRTGRPHERARREVENRKGKERG